MLIVCPNCQTSYEVAPGSLGAEGRSVRCVRCRQVWFATPLAEEPAAPVAETAGMSAAAASAQYRRGAVSGAEPAAADPWAEAAQAGDGADDDTAVDPNLAARAAERSTVRFDDPQVAGLDEAALAAHEAPPLAPAADERRPAREPGADIESFAARRARRERRRNEKGRGPGLGTLLFTLFAVNAVLIGWRSDVVRVMPGTASLFAAIGLPVNLRGLAFSDITTTKEAHDGATILVVQGTITNVSKQPREVPRIRLAIKNAKGVEVYTWTALPERTALAPGNVEPFHTRLASPPADGQSVEVRFFTRRDIARGGR